jgi:hypothetical protein
MRDRIFTIIVLALASFASIGAVWASSGWMGRHCHKLITRHLELPE